jgi:predicted N-formylglutamate amidohydrolase
MIFSNLYEIQNPGGKFPMVFFCEHARNFIPAEMNGLGVSPADLQTHIAWDIGIEKTVRRLSDLLDVPSVYCLYSRLIVDVGRVRDDPELIRPESDGVTIPGNIGLSAEERQARIDQTYEAYHSAAARLTEAGRARAGKPVIMNIHSYTPQLKGGALRPWQVGLSTYCDEGLMKRFAALLREEGVNAGVHKPYDLRDFVDGTLYAHPYEEGLPNILIEIRQDLIGDDEGVRRLSDILAKLLPQLI